MRRQTNRQAKNGLITNRIGNEKLLGKVTGSVT